MIRLVIYLVIFCVGLWAGAEYERVAAIDRCLAAGGAMDARGICSGVSP